MSVERVNAHIPLTFTLTAPLHHGAGSSGNVAMLREQAGVNPETGEEFTTPFVSGVTLRRALRQVSANHTLTSAGVQPGSVGKPLIDLLFNGGALTAGTGSEVMLEQHRKLDVVWPAAGLLGYATVGALWPGTLYVDHLLPVCAENRWRLPAHLAEHPHTQLPAAALVDEDFGTRGIGGMGDAARWAENQWQADPMPFEHQVLKPGAVLFSWFTLTEATPAQAALLRWLWDTATSDGIWLGGMRSRGYGHCQTTALWPDHMPAPAVPTSDETVIAQLREAAGR